MEKGRPNERRKALLRASDRPRHMHGHHYKWSASGFELVRRAFRDDREISFGDGLNGSAVNRRAREVCGVGALLAHYAAAGGQRSAPINHVYQLGFLFVNGHGSLDRAIFQIGGVWRE